ncbi:MAG: class I adenylate-forming enzyme family protein [Bacilli bacterium]|nr:class I adenylate-forming enzyme family protein [Bacilli bacterium]
MYNYKRPNIERPHLHHYGNIPANLDYPSKSVAEVMFDNCEKHKNYQAIKYTQNGITHSEDYTQYAENIESTAKMLKLLDVKKGDRIMVLSPFLPEEYHTKYAIAAVGNILIPLHPYESRSRVKMAKILEASKPKIIICLDSCVPDIDAILHDYPEIDDMVQRVLYFSPVDSLKKKGVLSLINPIIDYKYQKSGVGPKTLNTISNKFSSFAEERNRAKNYCGSYMANVKGEDDYVIYFSSGTSGKTPSGSIHTHNSCNSLLKSGQYICDCIEPGQKLIIVPGPFHCFGSETGRNTAINSGVAQIIIPDPKNLKALAEAQKKEKAELHIYVPAILSAMQKSELFDDISYENNELFICGGGRLPLKTYQYWNKKLPKGRGIREGYGSTPTNGGICINLKNEQRPGTIGIPLSDFYFKLKDPETGEIINKPNVAGELYVAGPSLMREILNEPNHLSLSTDEEGVTWYKTNDLVLYDETGWYKFLDRCDDILNLNNANLVNPNEIKDVLEKHNINNSIIFNTNGDKRAEGQDRIILCIEYVGDKEDITLLKSVLEKDFAENLKKYEIPSEIIVFDKLPMNLNGKTLKNETKEKYYNKEYKFNLELKR